MKINLVIGSIAAVAILVICFFLLHPPTAASPTAPLAPADINAATSPVAHFATSTPAPTPAKKGPSVSMGVATQKVVKAVVAFDTMSMTSTSANPVITGTANTPTVGIIVRNSQKAGIVGTGDITVEKGHWSYTVSVALAPGHYTVELYGAALPVIASLEVRVP